MQDSLLSKGKMKKYSNHKKLNIGLHDLKTSLHFKGALSGLTKCLAFENPLKEKKNAFYFTLKARFVLKILGFLS